MISQALSEAREELETLRTREAELEALIARAEATLDLPALPTAARTSSMTLHEALTQVLRDAGNEWMTARELADAVTDRGLYRKRDGSPVEVNQVHARTHNYSAIFEKDGPNVRLREGSAAFENRPESLIVFQDDDEGFFEWLDQHPDGYFINTERNPKPNYLVLHSSGCLHIDRKPSLNWTKDYVKICSPNRVDLEQWAAQAVGDEVTLCRNCFGGRSG